VVTDNDQFTNVFILYPDQEELNRDNTLNEVEEYFQYRVELKPDMDQFSNKYITDVHLQYAWLMVAVSQKNGRIPIRDE